VDKEIQRFQQTRPNSSSGSKESGNTKPNNATAVTQQQQEQRRERQRSKSCPVP
jgi:hypothetical protein